jgi:TPR repeat protein
MRISTIVLILFCAGAASAREPVNRKCSVQCAVELVNGCCPAVPDPSPIPSGGCGSIVACVAACSAGDGLSCTRAGWFSRQPAAGDQRDDARAIVLFDRACRMGDGRGCALGNRMPRAGYAKARHFEASMTRDETACQGGDGIACSKLSELHWEDEKYPSYANRACQLGVHQDCTMLAIALTHSPYQYFSWGSRHGYGMQQHATEFPGAFERACELDHHLDSCLSVASWSFHQARVGLSAERTVEAQWKSAFERLDPLCNQGETRACCLLGNLNDELLDRSTRPPGFDPSLGARLFTRACDLSDAEGCTGLGIALIRGRGVTADRAAAARALHKACELRSGNACVILSQITADPTRARALIIEGCDKGMRGPTGELVSDAGLREYPQRYRCNGSLRRP